MIEDNIVENPKDNGEIRVRGFDSILYEDKVLRGEYKDLIVILIHEYYVIFGLDIGIICWKV